MINYQLVYLYSHPYSVYSVFHERILRFVDIFRWWKFRIRKSDDGLPWRYGGRRRWPHPRKFQSRQRNVTPAQREPTGACLARWDEASSTSPWTTSHPPPSPHARSPSAPAAATASPCWLHAAVFLVPGGSESGIADVSIAATLTIHPRINPLRIVLTFRFFYFSVISHQGFGRRFNENEYLPQAQAIFELIARCRWSGTPVKSWLSDTGNYASGLRYSMDGLGGNVVSEIMGDGIRRRTRSSNNISMAVLYKWCCAMCVCERLDAIYCVYNREKKNYKTKQNEDWSKEKMKKNK